jgi:superoxide dismutase, Fe-Mn family
MDPIDRKKFLSHSIKAAFGTLFLGPLVLQASSCGEPAATGTNDPGRGIASGADATRLELSRIRLPYEFNALEPHIDARTMELHYEKHHKSYEDKFKEAMEEENITASTDAELFSRTGRLSDKARNNGGGVWNHNFFWQVMAPGAGGQPTGRVLDAINGSFDSFDNFKEKFGTAAKDRFGSGWAWLVDRNGKLEIGSTPNQDNPLMDVADFKGTPLLGLDVWEHAYYLKYQNKRAEYIDAWWNVVNWDEVARRMG